MSESIAKPNVTGVTVALAVPDLGEAVERYRAAFDLAEPEYLSSEPDGVEVAMFDLGGSFLQLVAPTNEESVIAKHLDANGSGLHHFGLVVDSVDDSLSHLTAQELRTLDDRARPGAGELKVGFVHPKTTLGAVVELIELPG